MIRCIGTKLVNAQPMSRLAYIQLRGWELPADENGDDAGFLVEYIDGGPANVPGFANYVSWSPSAVFAQSYRPVVGLSFGDAIEALKVGKRVARSGWNGKGMFIYMVPANSYPAQTDAAKAFFGDGSMVPYNAYFALKGVNDTIDTWVASISDTLAEDWVVLD